MWAQRNDRVLLTIKLENCVKPSVEIKDGSLYFKGKGGTAQTDHEVLMEFNKEIAPEVIFLIIKLCVFINISHQPWS